LDDARPGTHRSFERLPKIGEARSKVAEIGVAQTCKAALPFAAGDPRFAQCPSCIAAGLCSCQMEEREPGIQPGLQQVDPNRKPLTGSLRTRHRTLFLGNILPETRQLDIEPREKEPNRIEGSPSTLQGSS